MNFECTKYSYDEIHKFVKKSNDLTDFALLKLNICNLMIENRKCLCTFERGCTYISAYIHGHTCVSVYIRCFVVVTTLRVPCRSFNCSDG